MANHKLTIDVSWTGKNFCCFWRDDDVGTVVATAKTLAKLKKDFAESLKLNPTTLLDYICISAQTVRNIYNEFV